MRTGLYGIIAGVIIIAALLIAPAAAVKTGKIAFASYRTGWEIYVVNQDGSGLSRLTNNTVNDYDPAWSPNGTKIAFSSRRDGNDEIYVMKRDGSDQTRLTDDPAWDRDPAWSPNGTRIAFVSSRDGNNEVYVMNTDGSNQTRLTTSDGWDMDPSWSPNGTKIAFTSSRDEGYYNIYVMNADGSGQTRLTDTSAFDSEPSWSPNGMKIAFQSDRDGDMEIYVMDTDGSNQTRLTNNSYNGGGYEPTWSPDSRKIAFDSIPYGNYEIYVMNADGSGQTALTSDGSDKAVPDWYGPAVSSITPKSGKRGTTVKITNLTGKGFATGAKVSLVKGAKTIPGKAVTWLGLTRLKCKFAIPGTVPTGKWSVRVTNPDGVSGIRAKAFTVKA